MTNRTAGVVQDYIVWTDASFVATVSASRKTRTYTKAAKSVTFFFSEGSNFLFLLHHLLLRDDILTKDDYRITCPPNILYTIIEIPRSISFFLLVQSTQ